jgi:hypothetical protein
MVDGDLAWSRIEQWSWTAAVVVLVASAVLGLPRLKERRSRTLAIAAGAVLAWGPTSSAILAAASGISSSFVEVVGRGVSLFGLIAVVVAVDAVALRFQRAERLRLLLADSGVIVGSIIVVAVTVLAEIVDDPVRPERWTVPAAVLMLSLGGATLWRSGQRGSWSTLGPGVVLLLLPSLVLSPVQGGTIRIVALTVVATVIVVLGAVGRLQAPLAVGGLVLAAHGIAQLGPGFVALAETTPRWVVLSLAGAALLGLGVSYERRLAQMRKLRLAFTALR